MSIHCLKDSNKMTNKKSREDAVVRIDPTRWAPFLSAQFALSGHVTADGAEKLAQLIVTLAGEYLLCTKCERVLGDANFYFQHKHRARRQKAMICKECWKISYQKGYSND